MRPARPLKSRLPVDYWQKLLCCGHRVYPTCVWLEFHPGVTNPSSSLVLKKKRWFNVHRHWQSENDGCCCYWREVRTGEHGRGEASADAACLFSYVWKKWDESLDCSIFHDKRNIGSCSWGRKNEIKVSFRQGISYFMRSIVRDGTGVTVVSMCNEPVDSVSFILGETKTSGQS